MEIFPPDHLLTDIISWNETGLLFDFDGCSDGEGVVLLRTARPNWASLRAQWLALEPALEGRQARRILCAIGSGAAALDDSPHLAALLRVISESWCRWIAVQSLDRLSRQPSAIAWVLLAGRAADTDLIVQTPLAPWMAP